MPLSPNEETAEDTASAAELYHSHRALSALDAKETRR